MFLQSLDLTTALRPELLPDEILLFVQDAVGLYEGKFKIPSHQNGHAYLTSHRICYVDNAEARKNSAAVELKDVEKYEFYAGFLKSSSKITLYPKPPKRSSIQSRPQSSIYAPYSSTPSPSRSATASPLPRGASLRSSLPPTSNSIRPQNVTWVCPICSFSNPVPTNFDATTANALTPIPPCLACGIKPPLTHILKAAISGSSTPQATSEPRQQLLESQEQDGREAVNIYKQGGNHELGPSASQSSFQCPRCTFLNHPSLLSCELCGAPLLSADTPGAVINDGGLKRMESPGPTMDSLTFSLGDTPECIKLSFRAGGEKIFYERLKGAMVQRKWLLQNAPPVPQPIALLSSASRGYTAASVYNGPPTTSGGGIAGLERRGQELRKNNQVVIGNAFEDLEALMASAKEIVALAESFASKSADGSPEAKALIHESAAALGMITTKDMLGSTSGSDTLYLSELSRNLAEYLTDDRQGVLKKEGGIMSLVDLWAMFNHARNGVELISPGDFEKAARLWERLGLPVRLREFRNGLLVVQRHDWTDDKTIAQLLAWLQELHFEPAAEEIGWDVVRFGRGVTVQETASKFGWSVGVASEELEMAEEKGALCREQGVEGLRFWENMIMEL
ncbi:MAG: hypothetical protein Q9187_003538 [Circinaria calcarea]